MLCVAVRCIVGAMHGSGEGLGGLGSCRVRWVVGVDVRIVEKVAADRGRQRVAQTMAQTLLRLRWGWLLNAQKQIL